MSSQRSTKEINDLLLANFLAASANAGKPVLAAPLYKPIAPKEVRPSIDEQFAVLRACFGVGETVQPTEPVEPLLNKTKQELNPSALPRLNPNAPAWIPHSVMQEQEQEPEPSPYDFALRMRWTKTKDANGKVKRVFTRTN